MATADTAGGAAGRGSALPPLVPAAIAAATGLAARLGRETVRCPDRPGLLAGALLYPHRGGAVQMVQDGYASAVDIDTAMTAGCGYPRGPLRMLDDRGAATVLAGLTAMHVAYGDPAFAPPVLLAEHAAAGLPFCG
ncbi:MAG: 3-hydroxyacyl-CoA dehydrogenase family protein [Actinomycetota bacterium]